ncbi:hypothetical protein C8R46DRAFT_1293591 [Mycena filopes]|nr:hypothetical protein C8R46DRAFT_1293591 [Mycena filopes]
MRLYTRLAGFGKTASPFPSAVLETSSSSSSFTKELEGMDIVLPAELQREIFEIAIRSPHTNNEVKVDLKLSLSLVARHVLHWVDLVFYESVSVEQADKFLRLIDAKPPGFFSTTVKSLLIEPLLSDEQTAGILSACSGIESLAFWGTIMWGQIPEFPRLVNELPLRRLSAKFFHLATSIAFDPPPGWLQSLTHLDIGFAKPLMLNASASIVDAVTRLPRLTHLALFFLLSRATVAAVSKACPGLQVLVVIFDWNIIIPHARYAQDPLIAVVRRPADSAREDWEAGHFGLPDTWTCGEAIVAEQRAQLEIQEAS